MKTVKLKQVTSTKGKHRVALGNGTINTFKSLKSANKFLVDTSAFLTDKVYEANYLYIDVYTILRESWCLISGVNQERKGSDFSAYRAQRKCEDIMSRVPASLDKCVQRSGFANGNHFTFFDLRYVFNSISEVCVLLNTVFENRKERHVIMLLKNAFRKAERLKKETDEYGKTITTEYFKMPKTFNEYIEFDPSPITNEKEIIKELLTNQNNENETFNLHVVAS